MFLSYEYPTENVITTIFSKIESYKSQKLSKKSNTKNANTQHGYYTNEKQYSQPKDRKKNR